MAGASCGAPPATGSEPSGSPARRSAFHSTAVPTTTHRPAPAPTDLIDSAASLATSCCSTVVLHRYRCVDSHRRNMALGAESCMSALHHTACRGSAGTLLICRGMMCRVGGTNHSGWWLARRVLGQRHVSELGLTRASIRSMSHCP